MATILNPLDLAGARCIIRCVPEGAQKPILIYLFLRLLGMNADTATLNTVLANAKCVINCIPEGAQMGVLNSLASQILSTGISGVTGVYRGTAAERDALIPPGDALWILTDSTPAYQISVWNGSAWV